MATQAQILYEKVVDLLKERLISALGPTLKSLILYGSVARGEAHEESDIDLLLIVTDKGEAYERAFDVAFEIDLKHGTLTTLILHTPEELKRLYEEGEPFILEVLREGKVLYGGEHIQSYRRALQSSP